MKKILTLVLLLFLSFNCFSQKPKFGIEAGYLNAYAKIKDNSSSASTSDAGFFLGAFSEFGLSNKVVFTPHIDIGSINSNGFGFLSTLLGYYVIDDLKVEAGPQLSYLIETTPEEVNSLGIDMSLGLSYNITDRFVVSARYNSELSNRASNSINPEDLKARFNWLFIGLGYKF